MTLYYFCCCVLILCSELLSSCAQFTHTPKPKLEFNVCFSRFEHLNDDVGVTDAVQQAKQSKVDCIRNFATMKLLPVHSFNVIVAESLKLGNLFEL